MVEDEDELGGEAINVGGAAGVDRDRINKMDTGGGMMVNMKAKIGISRVRGEVVEAQYMATNPTPGVNDNMVHR